MADVKAVHHDVAVAASLMDQIQAQMQEALLRLPPWNGTAGAQAPSPGQHVPVPAAAPGRPPSHPSEPTINAALEAEEEAVVECQSGHKLLPYCMTTPDNLCDYCYIELDTGAFVKRCNRCEFDVCEVCLVRLSQDLPPAAGVNVLGSMFEDVQALLDQDSIAELQDSDHVAQAAANKATLIALGQQTPAGIRDEHVRGLLEASNFVRTLGLGGCVAITDAAICNVGNRYESLEHIYLDGTNITDMALSALAWGCPNLEYLSVRGCASVTDEGAIRIAKGCQKLWSAGLDGCSVTDMAVEALGRGCPCLREVSLKGCFRVTDDGVVHVAQGCPKLMSINLDGTSTADGALEALGKGCGGLQQLGLRGCAHVTDAGVVRLAQGCPRINAIILDGTSVGDRALKALGKWCPLLHSLFVTGCARVTDGGVIHVARPSLVRIRLDDTSVADGALEALGSNCPRLRELFLKGCTRVTDTGVLHVAEGCPDLERMMLDGTSVADMALEALARGCPRFLGLYLKGCIRVTENGLLRMAQKCPSLTRILLDCASATDGTLEALGKSCGGLQMLALGGCTRVTDAGVVHVAQGCPHLEHIDLDGTSIADMALEALGRGCPRLQEFFLGGCVRVTDRGVLCVAQGCPNLARIKLDGTSTADRALEALGKGCRGLQELSLKGCSRVTDAGVVHLAQGCPGLEGILLDRAPAGHQREH